MEENVTEGAKVATDVEVQVAAGSVIQVALEDVPEVATLHALDAPEAVEAIALLLVGSIVLLDVETVVPGATDVLGAREGVNPYV